MIKEDTWLSLSDSTCTHIAHTENTLKTLKKQNKVIHMTSVCTHTHICREKVTYVLECTYVKKRSQLDMIPVFPLFGSRGRRISTPGHPL